MGAWEDKEEGGFSFFQVVVVFLGCAAGWDSLEASDVSLDECDELLLLTGRRLT